MLAATALTALALVGPLAVVLATAFSTPGTGSRFRPSEAALADIPPAYLAAYERAGAVSYTHLTLPTKRIV